MATRIGVGVGLLTFAALIWYAIETMRLRRAAENQLEALAKPCLVLWAELRDHSDALLSMHQAVGNTVIRDDSGSFVVQNIGNGVALNVCYTFKSLDSPTPVIDKDRYYFLNVINGQKVTMPHPVSAYSGTHKITFNFQSIGGRRYESVVTFSHRVLTGFTFKPLSR